MKKKLISPPGGDGQLLLLPNPTTFLALLKEKNNIGTAHQPYFFNPGISLKFLFFDSIPPKSKKILFLDTDRVYIKAKVPSNKGFVWPKEFIRAEKVLYDYPAPSPEHFLHFFSFLEREIEKNIPQYSKDILENMHRFQEIILKIRKKLLKDILAESFLEFYGIKRDYCFISDIIKSEEFEDFFTQIYKDAAAYRQIFNKALDDYREEFRFRFKNFPFPKLQKDELPFWIVKSGERMRCFKKDVSLSDFKKVIIFPRAATLTTFLRLYKYDLFIHGVGGANYEWIGDRIIERFFKKTAAPYAVVSGTFLVGEIPERDVPYFFFNPERIKEKVRQFLQ